MDYGGLSGGGGSEASGAEGSGKPVMLVVFIGGVTYMEIAALRYLSRDPGFPFNILIAATAIVTGSSLLKSIQLDLAGLEEMHAMAPETDGDR